MSENDLRIEDRWSGLGLETIRFISSNQTLHLTAIPLRFIAAGELNVRQQLGEKQMKLNKKILSLHVVLSLILFTASCGQKDSQKDAETHFELGLAYSIGIEGTGGEQRKELCERAIEKFKQAIKINPEFADAYFQLGLVYGELERYDEGISTYKEAIRIKPDFFAAYYNLGETYHKLTRHDESITAYKEAIRNKPDFVEVHKEIDVITFGRQRAVKLHYMLGKAYLEVGQKDSALKEYKILKDLDAYDSANSLLYLINNK